MVGNVAIGGGAPVSVQTMANADPHDADALVRQIVGSAELGCDIVRLTVPDPAAGEVFRKVRAQSPVPLVADIHFDYRLALAAAARERHVPIRIGVNGGSLEKDILAKHGSATPEALVESALRHVALLEAEDYREIKISVKASDVPRTLAAYRLLSERTEYPLHLGVTEAGTFIPGTVRSCVALGALLLDGIGDTVRVSLTDTPAKEVRVGVELLRSVGLRAPGAAVTSQSLEEKDPSRCSCAVNRSRSFPRPMRWTRLSRWPRAGPCEFKAGEPQAWGRNRICCPLSGNKRQSDFFSPIVIASMRAIKKGFGSS